MAIHGIQGDNKDEELGDHKLTDDQKTAMEVARKAAIERKQKEFQGKK